MTHSLVDLPEDILHIICGYLDIQTLKSASQAHRSLSQVYQRHCYRTLTVDARSEHLWEKFELIERWDYDDRLKHIRHVLMNDPQRSRDGKALLQMVLSQTLPKMTGLRCVTWTFSGRSERLEEDFRVPDLPPKVRLEVQAAEHTPTESSIPVISQILSGLQHHMNLYSLDVAFDAAAPQLHGLFKTVLLTCSQLRIVKVRAQSGGSLVPNAGLNDPIYAGHRWTPEEVANFPSLEELEFDYAVIADDVLENWAIYGSWDSLRKLVLRDPRLLQYLTGKTPALQILSVGALSWLHAFLKETNNVESLSVTSLQNIRAETSSSGGIREILAVPAAGRLKTLELRLAPEQPSHGDLDDEVLRIKELAAACPRLEQLVMSIDPHQHRNADGTTHWQHDCAQAIADMTHLRRFAVVMPRILFAGTSARSSEFATLSTADDLWRSLCSEGRRLDKVSIIASMERDSTLQDAGLEQSLSNYPALTFVAMPAEKDWDAEKGEYRVDCLELAQAEASLARGDLHNICATGRYIDARKRVDDLASLAERGYVIDKKPPRPMPDYLTAAEEEDARSPPTRRRRAKRRINSAIDIFFDNFKPYNVETNTQLSQQEMAATFDPPAGSQPDPAVRRQLTRPFRSWRNR